MEKACRARCSNSVPMPSIYDVVHFSPPGRFENHSYYLLSQSFYRVWLQPFFFKLSLAFLLRINVIAINAYEVYTFDNISISVNIVSIVLSLFYLIYLIP